ncbi:MAG: sensor histidine kinase [Candidatus Dormibacteraceae bacterium]
MGNRVELSRPIRLLVGSGTARTMGWLAWCLTVGFSITTLAASPALGGPGPDRLVLPALVAISWATAGALIVSRQPRHTVGWLMLISALAVAASGTAFVYQLLSNAGHQPLPAMPLVARVGSLLIPIGVTLNITFLPLLFPDGRLPSARWRWPAIGIGLVVVAALTSLALTGEGPLTRLALVAVSLCAAVCVGSVIVRLLQAEGQTRQQLEWLVFALVVNALIFIIVLPGELLLHLPVAPAAGAALQQTGGLLIAAAIATAVLRYRLYDIELVIRWTLVYGILAAGIGAAYLALAALLGLVLARQSQPVAAVASAVLVAAIFGPLRDRLKRWVDRLVYGERHDPAGVFARVGARFERLEEAEALLPELVETIARSLRFDYVSIEVPRVGGHPMIAEFGSQADRMPLLLPLRFQGEEVGKLRLAPRRHERLSRSETSMLSELAPHIAIACHALTVMDELASSRAELVSAREEERRRLGRNLHDGLGPSLAAMVLQLEALGQTVDGDRPRLGPQIARLRERAQAMVAEVREMAYGLRPAPLEQLGLLAALRERALDFSTANGTLGGLQVRIECASELSRLPAGVEVAAYRIAVEALANTARHASARTCMVHLELEKRSLEVEVVDDGIGITGEQRTGVGIASMRERVAELGGRFTIEGAPGGGTRVVATLPLMRGAS